MRLKLEGLYGEMANILLQLFQLSHSRIGSLGQIDNFTWEVAYRPLSMPMNELIRLGSLPRACLPSLDTTFDTASSFFESLAEINMVHLMNQRNDAVDSADDCRRKFVARCLFRKLARERKLIERWASFENGPFKLWCDDFRPGNVLLTEDSKIAAVVDWEFTYTAPIEFSYAPPWWLLIERPEYWPTVGSLEDWCMEQLVVQKLEEMNSRVLAWDPDEYTLGYIDLAKKAKKAREESEKPVYVEVDEVDEGPVMSRFARLAV